MVVRVAHCLTLPGSEGFPGQRLFSAKMLTVWRKIEQLVTLEELYSSTCDAWSERFQRDYCGHQFIGIHLICQESSCLPFLNCHKSLSEGRSLFFSVFFKVCSSDFNVYQNHLEDLLKQTLGTPSQRFWISRLEVGPKTLRVWHADAGDSRSYYFWNIYWWSYKPIN